MLVDPNTPVRTFNFFEDPELKVMYNALNEEMKKSAALGLTTGLKKRERTNLEPRHLRQIMMLWDMENPRDVEHVFVITVMMHTGTRGGAELREMVCQQFEPHFKEGVGHYYTFSPMKQGKFKNYQGGANDYKKTRKPVQIFENNNVRDCFNPYKVISGYFSLLPRGWTDKENMNPLFLTPNSRVTDSIGFN